MSANSSHARNQMAMKPPQRFGTPIVECLQGRDLRKYASAEEHTRKTTARHFGFTKKVYGLPFSATPQQHNTVQNSIGIVGMSFMVRIYYSSGSSLKAGCLC